MSKKKKKKGYAYRVAGISAAVLAFAAMSGCTPIPGFEPAPAGGEEPTGEPPAAGAPNPEQVTGITLEVATWVLAALGLGPAARIVVTAKPFVMKLVDLLFGKPAKPATEPKPPSA